MRRGLVETRTAAQRAIAEARVIVTGTPTPSAATMIGPDVPVRLESGPSWASRAGEKLARALDVFGIDVSEATALDVGASTGGFTDVLLSKGAASVVAVDVGYGQMVWRLATDDRVRVIDRTNFRVVDPAEIGGPFDVVTVDVSFISVGLLAANLATSGRAGTNYVVLVKPQFEVGRTSVGKGGIVRDPAAHLSALQQVAAALDAVGIGPQAAAPSPIEGTHGNREFLLHGIHGAERTLDDSRLPEPT